MVFKMILSKSIFFTKKNVFFHVFIFFHFFSKTAENNILHMSEFVFNWNWMFKMWYGFISTILVDELYKLNTSNILIGLINIISYRWIFWLHDTSLIFKIIFLQGIACLVYNSFDHEMLYIHAEEITSHDLVGGCQYNILIDANLGLGLGQVWDLRSVQNAGVLPGAP